LLSLLLLKFPLTLALAVCLLWAASKRSFLRCSKDSAVCVGEGVAEGVGEDDESGEEEEDGEPCCRSWLSCGSEG
jgi:hypothetical protein